MLGIIFELLCDCKGSYNLCVVHWKLVLGARIRHLMFALNRLKVLWKAAYRCICEARHKDYESDGSVTRINLLELMLLSIVCILYCSVE